jgi:hypothetical protein
MLGSSWVSAQLMVTEEGLSSVSKYVRMTYGIERGIQNVTSAYNLCKYRCKRHLIQFLECVWNFHDSDGSDINWIPSPLLCRTFNLIASHVEHKPLFLKNLDVVSFVDNVHLFPHRTPKAKVFFCVNEARFLSRSSFWFSLKMKERDRICL